MNDPSKIHLKSTKIILIYVKGIIDFAIHYFKIDNVILFGFSNSDWGSDLDDMKSTFGNYFSLGFGLVKWILKK